MNHIPSTCPFCGGRISITRIHCADCDTTVEGRFSDRSFANLRDDQMYFIETFLRCEGKIKRVEKELDQSYPTIRGRLHEVIRAMGYEPGVEEDAEMLTLGDRQTILEDLDVGRITADQALQLLQEKGG